MQGQSEQINRSYLKGRTDLVTHRHQWAATAVPGQQDRRAVISQHRVE